MSRLRALLPARRWPCAPCGCTWHYGWRSLTYLACQRHAPMAPAIRVALATGTAHLTGGGR